jgi:Protein of unknown function (DUF4013)
MATATPVPSGSVDFGRSFTFPTEDPEWLKKILIGGVFVLLCGILVGIPFVLGYFGRTLRNVAEGAARPMPDWENLGDLFNEGLRLTAVYLVYALAVGAAVAAVGCLLLLPLLAAGHQAEYDATAAVGALSGLGMLAFYGVAMLASLALAVYVPAALVRCALRGTVADGFAWQPIVGFIRANLGNYLLSLVIYLVASFVAQFGIILCCVGLFPAAFWSYMVFAVALGQTVRLNPGSI